MYIIDFPYSLSTLYNLACFQRATRRYSSQLLQIPARCRDSRQIGASTVSQAERERERKRKGAREKPDDLLVDGRRSGRSGLCDGDSSSRHSVHGTGKAGDTARRRSRARVRRPVGWHVLVVVVVVVVCDNRTQFVPFVSRLVERGSRQRTTRPSRTDESGPSELSDPATATTSRHHEFPIVSGSSSPPRLSPAPTIESTR